ncbi:MAG: hypothetical protein Q9212_002501 [Teloschistes hypoglaucus]
MFPIDIRCSSSVCRILRKYTISASKPALDSSQAQQATSEEAITVNSQLCGRPNQNFLDQIRADFTNCALPSDSLSTRCVTGEENEPNDCGFSSNLQGLCGYCGASSPNATDSCCVGSNVTSRCKGVTLPTTFSLPPLFPSSTSASAPSATGSSQNAKTNSSSHHGLSGGQIAGIAVGSVAAAILILGLILLCCTGMLGRWRNRHQRKSIFNQPSPPRRGGPGMALAPPPPSKVQVSQTGPETQSGGRVTRMAALTGNTSESPSSGNGTAAAAGRRYGDSSESEGYGETPGSARGGHPATGKRNGSLSSQSMLGALDDHSSPNSGSGGQYSSPEGVASGQSEQLPSFKDYYSHDDIHPGDAVATLWAYQPRAGDEFELERGDMLKIVGLWDDGWATGVRLNERAETYIAARRIQRDSGMSQGPGRRGDSASPTGMIKAFPVSRLSSIEICFVAK